jgi:hypothetical protein
MLDEVTDRVAVGSDAAVDRERRRRRLSGSTRGERPELSRSVLARLGIDAVDAHDPFLALLAHRRSACRLPCHGDPLLIPR